MLLLFDFFTPVLADVFSLEFEWQQVFSSLHDSSQYSGRSQQCCSLDVPHSSFYFHVLQSFLSILWCLYQEHQLQLVSTFLSLFNTPARSLKKKLWNMKTTVIAIVIGAVRIIIIIIIILLMGVYHISDGWWFFRRV